MNTGNLFVYEVGSIYGPSYRYKVRITGDTLIQGHRYFICSQNFPGYTENLVRIDSVTGNIMTFKPGSNCFYYTNQYSVDSLQSRMGDTLKKCMTVYKTICIDTLNTTLFGSSVKRKVFKQDDLIYKERYYCRNFGIYFARFVEGDETWHTLKGCKINGITYGDTLLTGISYVSESVPASFSLYQNYPNPFNPVTKIRFDIPENGKWKSENGVVTLKVYDILGKEVTTLVNERLQPGTYETAWDASGFGSGVYFCRFAGPGHSETKKMIVLK
ncbi:MAG: T9SS type A sorting domain-containing protein [Bacteroidetes bacterium]|nr:T9SS type A sorting domain-containing protein [Bacteroidota bacterium]